MAVNKVVYGNNTIIDLTGDTATEADVVSGKSFHLASGVRTTGTATYANSPVANGNATKTNGILYGAVDSTSTSTVFTATVDGLDSYYDGACVLLKNGVVTSAAGYTINVNNLGAKPVYSSMAAASATTTIFNVAYTLLFVYDSTRIDGGCWVAYYGYYSDSNSTGYQIRTQSALRPASDKGYRYRLWFSSLDGSTWIPANTSTSTNATAKRTPNTRTIDPFGEIVYNSTNGATDAGANLPVSTCWTQYIFALGYSFNTTGVALTLTNPAPVYLKCTPQSGGGVQMNEIVQALPSTEDGKVYIFLGTAYSNTNIELFNNHPVYYYSNGAIRRWTNAETCPLPATATPLMDGIAAVGTATKYAREDHRHPMDTNCYRFGETVSNKRTGGTSDPPYYVSFNNNKKTLDFPSLIRAVGGVGDHFYSAYNNPNMTVTCNYSGIAMSTLFNPAASSTILIPVADLSTNPFTITVEKTSSGNITATDVTHMTLFEHTLNTTAARLTDYKLEILTTGSTASTGDYSWQTVYERNNVSDIINGLTMPMNDTAYSYLYFRGVRFTVSGATPIQSTNPSGWGYNSFDLALFCLFDTRPAFSAARALGALDIHGGEVFGAVTLDSNLTVRGTLTGNLSGNATSATSATSATTATKATQDESGNNIKASYGASLDISGTTLSLKNKNGTALNSVTIPSELPSVTSSDDGKVLTVVSGAWEAATGGGGSSPSPATANPLMDGTAAVGTSAKYAREDHVHPSDTNKQDAISDLTTIRSNATDGETAYTRSTNKVLYYTSVAVSAGTGDIATVSNAAITADHVVTSAVFADPSKITSQVTWTTAAGSLTLNGTCSSATTANIVLIKKDN